MILISSDRSATDIINSGDLIQSSVSFFLVSRRFFFKKGVTQRRKEKRKKKINSESEEVNRSYCYKVGYGSRRHIVH
jgi:hypothetical protein